MALQMSESDRPNTTAVEAQQGEPRPWVRNAASLFLAQPSLDWVELARLVGRSARQLQRVRRSGEFARALDLAFDSDMRLKLQAAAGLGLISAWQKGRSGHTAFKLLQAEGKLPADQLRLSGDKGSAIEITDPELNARIDQLLQEMPARGEVIDQEPPPLEAG